MQYIISNADNYARKCLNSRFLMDDGGGGGEACDDTVGANIPDGMPEATMRTVTENCRTLRFESFSFEEE